MELISTHWPSKNFMNNYKIATYKYTLLKFSLKLHRVNTKDLIIENLLGILNSYGGYEEIIGTGMRHS